MSESKTHSRDLFAIVHNALSNADLDIPDPFGGHETRAQIAKAVVALRSIVEQYEVQNDRIEQLSEQLSRRIGERDAAEEQLEAARRMLDGAWLCPIHGIPDCSPLLNGCSRVNQIVAWIAQHDGLASNPAKRLNLSDELGGF